jgi:two-component system, NtrC family, C4-dicarboxylate transport response regulator DctD
MAGKTLILDDNHDTVELLQTALIMEGFRADAAHDHHTAVERLRSEEHCALFMDYRLPGMEPARFVSIVRSIQEKLPIILMSGDVDVHKHAIELGVNMVLPKPFELDSVTNLVKKLCA